MQLGSQEQQGFQPAQGAVQLGSQEQRGLEPVPLDGIPRSQGSGRRPRCCERAQARGLVQQVLPGQEMLLTAQRVQDLPRVSREP